MWNWSDIQTFLNTARKNSVMKFYFLMICCFRYKLTKHTGFVNDIKFDTSGKFFVTISHDKQLVLWDYNRLVSIATFPANCQIQAMDLCPSLESIAYIPKGISDVAILKPNQSLCDILAGKNKTVTLTPQAQAVVLTFSGQRSNIGSESIACCLSWILLSWPDFHHDINKLFGLYYNLFRINIL